MKRTELHRRTPLGPGERSLERGSTFGPGKPARHKPRAGFTPASDAQRGQVAGKGSIVSGERPCDPCHVTSRAHGGCDHPLCVIPLTRAEHRAFDDGSLDVLPYMIAHRMFPELAHAVSEHGVDPLSLLHRLTGQRWAPVQQPQENG